MSSRSPVFALFALAALPLGSSAQQVEGMVFDEASSAPVAAAEVRVLDGVHAEVAAARTDDFGRFSLSADAPGRYVVVASADDYMTSSPVEVELAAGGSVNLMISLASLPGVTVADRASEGPDAYVFGTVVGRESGRPVDGAEVVLAGPADTVRTATRWNGRFVVPDLPPGRVEVRVEHLAYAPEARTVEMEPGRAYELEVELRTEAIELPGIEVTVRSRSAARFLEPFYQRMDRGLGGHFMDREELEIRGAQPVGFALNRFPSTKVRSGYGGYWDVTLRGRCKPGIFVDRVLVARGGVSELLDMSTVEVEGIEVYPGPATLPAEFNFPGVTCAVAIWTRRGG